MGVLAAGIAHEIGTPLGVMRTRAELVLEKLGVEHAQARGLAIIIEQADQVTRTIRGLLDFSRVQPATAVPIGVSSVVERSVELLRYEMERRKVSVTFVAEDKLPPVAANTDELQQVFVNLLMNACDACGPNGQITISADREFDRKVGTAAVRIVIADNGRGIAPDDLVRVFDPFFTTKKRGQGTGLGLAVVMQIVRNHGARIALDSQPGKGTVATLIWPTVAETHEVLLAG